MEFNKILDKSFVGKPLAETLDAPVSALNGVSESDAKHLAAAFNIKTIRDLATNKFFLSAQEMYQEAQHAVTTHS